MNKTKCKRIFIDLIILAIIFSLAFFSFPIFSRKLHSFIVEQSENIFEKIKTSIGIDISYEQLSPALISKINLKNVLLKDTEGNKIASFENILVEYNILDILKRNMKSPIKQITIRDGEILYNEQNKDGFFAKVFNQKNNTSSSKEKNTAIQSIEFPFEDFNVRLQNIFIYYETNGLNTIFSIYSGKIFSMAKKITYKLNSNFEFLLKKDQTNHTAKFDFDINGSAVSDFSFMSSVLKIHSLKINNTKLTSTSFFISLQEKTLSLLAFQQNEKMDIQASYNFEESTGSISLGFENIKVSNLVNSKLQEYKFLNTTKFSGFLFAYIDLKENAKDKIKYSTDITASTPLLSFNNFTTKNFSLKLTASGNDKYVDLKKLDINSNNINFNSYGYYNFKNGSTSFVAYLNRLLVNNANIKTQLNLSGSKRGYVCKLPEIEIGEALFENAKIIVTPVGSNYDISFMVSDETGEYNFDATYTKNKKNDKFVEAHGVLNSINVKNIYKTANAFIQNDDTVFLENILNPFRITTEFYFSSDLKSYSYNFIQLILASTEADGMYLLSSFNGSNESFNLENFNLNIANQQINGKVNAGFGRDKDVFFDSLFSIGGISYTATGIFSNNIINIYGDYGLSVTAYLENKTIKGNFALLEFPIPILPFVFSTNSSFTINSPSDWQVICETAKVIYTQDAIVDSFTQNPFQLNFSGTASPKNIFLSEIVMGNNENTLSGQASFDSISNDFDFLKQFSVIAKLNNSDNSQVFNLNCNFAVAEEIFMDGTCDIQNISFATFSNKQAKDDIINGQLTFLGTLDNILLQANLEKLKMHINNKPLEASCMFLIDDGTVRIPDANLNWNGHTISSLEVNFIPKKGSGNLGLNYSGEFGEENANANIKLDIAGKKVLDDKEQMTTIEKVISLLESFVLNATVENANLGENKLKKPFKFTITRDKDTIAFYDIENKITGFHIDDGTVSLSMTDDFKTRLSFDGSITDEDISLMCYDIRVDIPQIFSFVSPGGFINFDTGNLNGDLLIEGKLDEPQFYGTIYLDDANFNSPDYAPDNLFANNIPIIFDKYFLEMPQTAFKAKNFDIIVECTSEFDGWVPYNTVVKCSIDKERPGHMKTKNLLFHADGYIYCNIEMNITLEDMYLGGSAFFDNGNFSIAFDTFDEFAAAFSEDDYGFTMDLALGLGNRAEYNWPNMQTPILRTLIPTETPIVFYTDPDNFTMTGIANMRGGEITYIKRNFYVKEGNIKFVETIDGFIPLLSLRAEIRDKDIEDKPVKLILTLDEQPLINNYDTWITKITAEPAKSEQEVLQLLGQLVTGDMDRTSLVKDTLTNATDFAGQITVAKNVENAIRDFLHLDVLSLRTQVLQNVVFGNLFKKQEQANLKVADYLDNTSLYFGKYFGSAIYADAALHLSNYDPLVDTNLDRRKLIYKGVLFEPEIGLEMATPFFNIRWATSPTNIDSLFVDNTSLTFSWNFSY